MDIDTLLYHEIIPLLTDFINNQKVFHRAFIHNQKIGHPIKRVLELGVFATPGSQPPNPLHGQSTKVLLALCAEFKADFLISVDINDCRKTIDFCRNWVASRGFKFKQHSYVKTNSLEFGPHQCQVFDLIFLDTNHDDNYPERIGIKGDICGAGFTYREICQFANILSDNGRLFVHDTKCFYVTKRYGWNTAGAIDRFMNEQGNKFKFREHHTNKFGLGEIVRIDSEVW